MLDHPKFCFHHLFPLVCVAACKAMGKINLLLLLSVFIVTSNSQSCTNENDLRLVWGNGPWEGNLQICINGNWGWVCDNSFGTVDAQVACRQLGFQTTGAVYRMWSYYGLGNISTPLLLDGLNCAGNENRIIDCPRPYPVGVVSCLYNEIAGIVCPSGGPPCTGNQIRRLRNSNGTPFRGNGRVEMCYNGQWGRVCDDSWGGNDAKVACYELGFTKQRVATYCCSRYFGRGYGSFVYDDVACSSAETSLISCNSRSLGSTNCGTNTNSDAGIGCYGTITSACTNGDVKLWRPSDGPEYFGLALYCKNSKWTGVCDDSFTCHTARLICEQLGYPGALYYRGEGYWGYFYSTLGNNGVDHYAWSCSSSHTSLSQCSYYYHSSCNAYHDQFGIMCTPNDQKSECTTGTVRLVNGTSSNNGRVEYCFDGGWASLCGLSAPASTAVCRTLGFNTSFASIYNDERYGRNNNPSSLSYLNCPKSATHVNQCTAIRKGNGGCWRSVSRCGREYSVQCYNNIGECTDGSFRLVNGTIEQEGRVEICTNGLWGAVCHGSWNSIDAFVLCRSLGYGGSGPTTYWTSTFGLATGPAPWKNVLCYGWENTLFDCQKTIYPYDSCPVQNTVGVACKDGCTNGQVRLVGGNFENEGTIQVCYGGRWGQVSDQGWNANGARVVCNQLGYTGGNAVPTIGSSYGKSNLTIHLKFVACSGNEINIDLCSKTKLSLNKGKLELVTAQVAGVDCIYDVPTDPPCIATPPLFNTQGNYCGAAQNRTVRINPNDPPGNGRVQYCYNGYWSPFCNMDLVTASIACNDLGYTGYSWGSIIDNGNYATDNFMNISLFDRVSCTGSESSISQCTLVPSDPSCTPYCSTNLGLRCYDNTIPSNQCSPEGSLRLADGVIDNEGRVEVCVNGVWGSVCDQGFDKTDAHVVCQQLGHPELEPYIFTNSTFGAGQFPIVYSNLGCVGYENSLAACQKQTYPNTTCSRNNVAGVLCGYDCTDGDIRLVGSQWNYEGTVEICFDNLWGLISDSVWTLSTAQVICQQLGYQAEGTLAVRGSQYGKPNNLTIHFRNVSCNGDEATFSDCSYSTLSLAQGKALLATDDVAGVKCYTPDQCVPPPPATGNECTNGALRQRGGQGGIPEGNLEYCYRGYWSPFCYLGTTEATVACRQLGYSSYDLTVIFSDGRFGSISNTSLFQNITCESNPNAGLLSDCQVIDTCQSRCPNAIGLRCYESGNCMEGSVRLVNGSFTTEGRVEVCSNGIWGSICSNKFTAIDAYVICKELGYGLLEPTVYNNSYYGDGDGSIVISELDCKGYEPTVLDCAKKDYGSFTCSRDNVIGIVCQENCQDGDIQLSGGTANTQGTVQYCYYNTWGLISDNSWSDNAARVVCSQLGHTGGTAVRGSAYGKPNRTIVLSTVDCAGTENSLQDCQSSILSPDDGRTLYPHVAVAGVMCVDSTPAPTTGGSSGVVSTNSAAIGLAIVMIFLILIILVTIGMILYVFFMRQKVIRTNAVLNEPRVKMSGLGDTGVNNPMVGLDEEGLEDFNTADQDELVDRLNKM